MQLSMICLQWDANKYVNFQMSFSELKGKIVLIENTASLWGTTVRDFTQLNDLCEKYGDKLVSNNSDLISKLFIEVFWFSWRCN